MDENGKSRRNCLGGCNILTTNRSECHDSGYKPCCIVSERTGSSCPTSQRPSTIPDFAAEMMYISISDTSSVLSEPTNTATVQSTSPPYSLPNAKSHEETHLKSRELSFGLNHYPIVLSSNSKYWS